MIVPGKKYSALIQGYPNDTSGLYPVFISELHAIDKSLTTVKVKNKLSNYGKWMYEGKVYSSGSYIPLHPGMTVTVVFLTASALSGSITEIHYDHTPFDKINQVGIHLIAKTPGGSQIYLDDSRGVTHIMHNNGRTNALLSDDKISLSVNETSNVGSNFISGVEVGKEGIFLKFGTTSISINESGIAFKVGEAEYIFDDKALKANTENVNLNIKNFELKSNKTFITAEEEAHLKSTVTRVTGGQHISMTGNVIGVDSNLHTSVRSGVSVSIDSLSHIDIDSTIINIDALGSVAVRGTAALLTGVETVVNGVTTAINGSNIFEDSMIIRGMGVASSLSAGLVGSTILEPFIAVVTPLTTVSTPVNNAAVPLTATEPKASILIIVLSISICDKESIETETPLLTEVCKLESTPITFPVIEICCPPVTLVTVDLR
jgi:hypothetical protein